MEPDQQQKQEENSTNSGAGVQPSDANEIESTEDGVSTPETQVHWTAEPSGEEQDVKVVEPEEEDCIIGVKLDGGSPAGGCGGGGGGESSREEKVCRICHLSPENSSDNSGLIQLGCGCKAELGFSHLHCAVTWFKHKGNRQCEICGKTAKNITGIQDTRIFMVEWNERRLMRIAADTSVREGPCQCRNSTCNFLLACLVLAFVLAWFFRVDF